MSFFSELWAIPSQGVSHTMALGLGTVALLFGYDQFPKKFKPVPPALLALVSVFAPTLGK